MYSASSLFPWPSFLPRNQSLFGLIGFIPQFLFSCNQSGLWGAELFSMSQDKHILGKIRKQKDALQLKTIVSNILKSRQEKIEATESVWGGMTAVLSKQREAAMEHKALFLLLTEWCLEDAGILSWKTISTHLTSSGNLILQGPLFLSLAASWDGHSCTQIPVLETKRWWDNLGLNYFEN